MRRLVILLIVCALALGVVADNKPTRGSVGKQKERTEREIKRTRGKINQNLADTERELAKLGVIEGELRRSRGHADSLQRCSDALRRHSAALTDTIALTDRRLGELRASYGRALRAVRRQRQAASDAAFIFSAAEFAGARARVRYLTQLSQWQKQKAAQIQTALQVLEHQRHRLDSLNGSLALSIDSLGRVNEEIARQKNRADAVVTSLRRQRRNLDKVLAEQERQYAELDRQLAKIIEEEQRLERERKKAKQTVPGATRREQPPASDFAANRGKLPLPLDRPATVSSTFGRHGHAELSKVEVQNNGIDFETEPGASACAVAPGTVSMVIVMDGFRNVVLVRHGEYLTVYAGLDQLSVKKGDAVAAGQKLGKVFTNAAASRTRLHFEIRHEKDKLDPAEWLRL